MTTARDLAASELPTTDALLAALAAGTVSQGWDVVCSYHVSELNALLQTNPSSSKSVEVPFTAEGTDPLSGDAYTVTGTVQLAPPVLTFVAGLNGICDASMAITGGTYTLTVKGQPPRAPAPIPDAYNLVAQLYLIAVFGDNSTQSGGGVIVFNPGAGNATIVLHFNTSDPTEITWRIQPIPSGGDDPVLNQWVLPGVVEYFQTQVKEIDYAVAGVDPAPAPGQVLVAPTSFHLTTWASKDNDPDGVLSIFVAASPDRPANAPQPAVPPIVQMPLVTQDHTVSLIFSPDFMRRAYLGPQLTAQNYIVANVGPTPIITAAKNSLLVIPHEELGGQNLGTDDLIEVSDVEVFLDEYPYTIGLTSSAVTIQGSIVASQSYEALYWGGDHVGWVHDFNATATSTITMNKSVLLAQAVTITDEAFSLSFSIASSDYSVSTDPGTSHGCWNNDTASEVQRVVSTATAAAIPAFTIDLGGLNFFRATNLLFPGQNVVNVDVAEGLHAPYDTALFGNIGQPH